MPKKQSQFDLLYGQLNPGLRPRNRTAVARQSTLIDDPRSVRRRSMIPLLQADIFEGVTTFRAIVLRTFRTAIADTGLYNLLKTSILKFKKGASTEGELTYCICMIPELHAHLENPFDFWESSELSIEFAKRALRYPVFSVGNESSSSNHSENGLRNIKIGDVVEIHFTDPERTIGYVSKLIHKADIGILEGFSSTEAIHSAAPTSTSPAPTQSEANNVPGIASNIPGINKASNSTDIDNLTSDTKNLLLELGNTASDLGYPRPVVTSGVRTANSQITAMADNYKTHGFVNTGFIGMAGHEAGLQYLSGLYGKSILVSDIARIFEQNWSGQVTDQGISKAVKTYEDAGSTLSRHTRAPPTAFDLRNSEGIRQVVDTTKDRVPYDVRSVDEGDHVHVSYMGAIGETEIQTVSQS